MTTLVNTRQALPAQPAGDRRHGGRRKTHYQRRSQTPALVEMRVSQINGCAFCLDMHATDARKLGERQQRLDCLPAWGECELFDAAEKAALAWAEALTDVSHTHAPDEAYDALTGHFSEQQIVDLTLIVAMINCWNRIAIAHRTQPPGR